MTAILSNPRERSRFMRFALVGVIGFAVNFIVLNLLTDLLNIPDVPASVCSFAAAVVSNFTWNRYWTYPDSRSKPITQQISQFGLISLIGLLINTFLFTLLLTPSRNLFSSVHIPLISGLSPDFLGRSLTLVIATVVVMFWNFFVNRYWTYGDVE
jgi:putative flippase GtrA